MGDNLNSSNSKMILLVLYFGWIVSYIDRTVVSLSIVKIGEDLSLDASKLGIVLSAFFMGYALMQIPGGWLSDRFGSRKVIVIAVLFWSVFTALTGLAWSLTSLLLIRFLFGIGEGGYPSASTKAISDYFPVDKRTKAQSTMMSSNALGGALAPIICAPLLVWLGWRHVFWVISLLGIIFVIWFLLSTRQAGVYSNSDKAHKPNQKEYKQLLKNPYLWKVLLVFFFINITSWGLSSWMPSYLMQVLGINLKSIGIISAIPTLFLAAGMIISGRIINKIGSNAKYGVITGIFIMGISLYLMTLSSSIVQVIIYQCIAFTFMSFVMSFIFTLPHRVMEQKVVGTAFGILNFGGQAAGIFSPMIMGALIASSGGSYKSAFLFLTVCCLIAGVIACFLPSAKRNHEVTDSTVKTVG
ncbi:MFS transporter [Peribacillus frigoritolerans]|jgi:MFS family permease|uniref:MFS transporter n=1 Tax=Peribacillus frigoritolerans TaxID=450367 RepID=UPI00228061EF|nr:MFS transporter [Peribacillus frigoritolerans]MCY9002383.1 MFS transporter [Peribacillus frigoritolerans]MED4632283.1 MFS transporter [Peribacillus frigoritolerans]